MKIKILSILFIFTVLFCIAQDVLLLPFDATSLTEEQKALNPDYRAYPTILEDSMPTVICNDDLPDCMEAVDLGLSVKWATCNVGAKSPDDFGDYFAWGETEPKKIYNWSTYKWCEGKDSTITKYCNHVVFGSMVDNKIILEPEDDAATANWGGSWRMPTDEEITELRENCTWEWIDNYKENVDGYLVLGINGNGIFIPAAGSYQGTLLTDEYKCNYWSSTIAGQSNRAHILNSYDRLIRKGGDLRCVGYPIRPVCQ